MLARKRARRNAQWERVVKGVVIFWMGDFVEMASFLGFVVVLCGTIANTRENMKLNLDLTGPPEEARKTAGNQRYYI